MFSPSFTQPFRGLGLAFASDLAVDLGTSNTIIYAPGRGIVVNEPSVVAIDNRDNQILIAGRDAKIAIGREPQVVRIVRPVRSGVIADFVAAEKMLSYFMRRALGQHRLFNPRVLICTPGEMTPVERRAVEDAIFRAGAKRAEIVEGPIAAAAGAGFDIQSGKVFMIVDIGGGTTDIAVLSCGGLVHISTLRVGGNAIDKAIADYLRYKRGLEVGELTAEAVKLDLGSTVPQSDEHAIEISGRNTTTSLPERIALTGKEVRLAIEPVVQEIVRAVRNAMEELPPEISADLLEAGMVVSGGASQLAGLKERFEQAIGLEVRTVPNAAAVVALGAGQLLLRSGRTREPKLLVEQGAESLTAAKAS